MRLVTFQSLDALKDLFSKGYLECDETKINIDKMGVVYNWVVKKMNDHIPNIYQTKYPLWCWVKCYNSICPPKKIGKAIPEFQVKITFHKEEKDVFITDFRRYSFLLNNQFIPKNRQEKIKFEQELEKYHITSEDLKAFVRKDKFESCRKDEDFKKICAKIEKSYDRCITKESNILQGCIWRININEIEKIEFLKDDGYIYGSVNYIRSNGKRLNWIDDFYKSLI